MDIGVELHRQGWRLEACVPRDARCRRVKEALMLQPCARDKSAAPDRTLPVKVLEQRRFCCLRRPSAIGLEIIGHSCSLLPGCWETRCVEMFVVLFGRRSSAAEQL